MNNVSISGRLTRNPELKYTNNNTAVSSFTLAVNRRFANANGEREADFINCIAWGKTAEVLVKYIRKGGLIEIAGRIQTRSWENQEGTRHYATEVVVEELGFLESKSKNEGQTHQTSAYTEEKPDFPTTENFSTINITDDDLPF